MNIWLTCPAIILFFPLMLSSLGYRTGRPPHASRPCPHQRVTTVVVYSFSLLLSHFEKKKLIDDRYNKKSLSFLFSKGLGVWAQYKMWNVSHYSTWMKTKTNHKEALNVEPNTVCGHIYGTFGTALKNGYLKWLFCPIMTINNFRFDIKIEHLCCPKSLMSKKHVSNGMFP